METLVKSILANPWDFDPLTMRPCVLRELVEIAQDVTPQPQELQSAVVHHHEQVGKLAHV